MQLAIVRYLYLAKIVWLRWACVNQLPTGEQNFLTRSGLRIKGIGRMKLNMWERAQMRTLFAGNQWIEP
jgi:hypothetical protein